MQQVFKQRSVICSSPTCHFPMQVAAVPVPPQNAFLWEYGGALNHLYVTADVPLLDLFTYAIYVQHRSEIGEIFTLSEDSSTTKTQTHSDLLLNLLQNISICSFDRS